MAAENKNMRQVISWKRYLPKYAKPGATRVILTLSCGHTAHRKGSRVIPIRVHCRVCANETPERKD